MDLDIIEEEKGDSKQLKKKLSACQQFLVDTEMDKSKHKVYNFKMSMLDTTVINKLDSGAKVNTALGFDLQNTIYLYHKSSRSRYFISNNQ